MFHLDSVLAEVFCLGELPEGELVDTTNKKEIEQDEKYNLVQAAKLLAGNKFYMMICVTYILQQIYGAMISMGTYYATYILGNQNLFGVFSWAINIPLIIALVFTPTLVAKWNGMYQLNVMSYTLATISRALVAVAGYMGSGNVTLMLLFTAIAALGQGPWPVSYTHLQQKCRLRFLCISIFTPFSVQDSGAMPILFTKIQFHDHPAAFTVAEFLPDIPALSGHQSSRKSPAWRNPHDLPATAPPF